MLNILFRKFNHSSFLLQILRTLFMVAFSISCSSPSRVFCSAFFCSLLQISALHTIIRAVSSSSTASMRARISSTRFASAAK